jgi:hypothetical protein
MQAVLRAEGSHGCKKQLRSVNAMALRLDARRTDFKEKMGFSRIWRLIK